ncbi:hypothetical protein ACJ6WE_21645 [Streptomyces sp. MMS24-I31]|uniref:hypothetical protein n=1 Tax=Streptomyces sp. MMS24-I31 TaxID=3351563 RepID=UPI003896C6C1
MSEVLDRVIEALAGVERGRGGRCAGCGRRLGPSPVGAVGRPTFISTIGKADEKIFGVPVAVIATGIDFYYTPEAPRAPGDTHVDAPGEPGKVRYR